VGIINGDGFVDAAIDNSGGSSIIFLINDPQGGFAASTQTFSRHGNNPIFADMNRDGYIDLIYQPGDAQVLVLGNGTFQANADFYQAWSGYSNLVGDVNNDGYPDLLVNKGFLSR
jgi:hypothetical protein